MRIIPGLVAEKLIKNSVEENKYSSSIIDYKFWCFNGEPHYCMVCSNRTKTSIELLVYDVAWNVHPEYLVASKDIVLASQCQNPRIMKRCFGFAESCQGTFLVCEWICITWMEQSILVK